MLNELDFSKFMLNYSATWFHFQHPHFENAPVSPDKLASAEELTSKTKGVADPKLKSKLLFIERLEDLIRISEEHAETWQFSSYETYRKLLKAKIESPKEYDPNPNKKSILKSEINDLSKSFQLTKPLPDFDKLFCYLLSNIDDMKFLPVLNYTETNHDLENIRNNKIPLNEFYDSEVISSIENHQRSKLKFLLISYMFLPSLDFAKFKDRESFSLFLHLGSKMEPQNTASLSFLFGKFKAYEGSVSNLFTPPPTEWYKVCEKYFGVSMKRIRPVKETEDSLDRPLEYELLEKEHKKLFEEYEKMVADFWTKI